MHTLLKAGPTEKQDSYVFLEENNIPGTPTGAIFPGRVEWWKKKWIVEICFKNEY